MKDLNAYRELIVSKIIANIQTIAESMVEHIVEHFVDAIGAEGADSQMEDPAHPLHYIDEFRQFLMEEMLNANKHSLTDFGVSLHTGDGPRLGFDEALEDDDTDAIKIIGTVIQGIAGNYVLVLPEQAIVMFGERFQQEKMGRFGGAFIMPVDEYEEGMIRYGWPEAQIWEFSNFPGVPDLFDNPELEKVVEKKIGEVLSA